MTRRTLVLLALVAVGVLLAVVIEPPVRRTGKELARGPHVFRTSEKGIRRMEVSIGDRRFVGERVPNGWRLDGAPAGPRTSDALQSLAAYLAELRAVDAFRTRDFAGFGLDPPAGVIVVTTGRGTTRLAIGTTNASASAVYARRDDQPRVLQLGSYLLAAIEHVPDGRDDGASASRDRIVRLADAAGAATEVAQLREEEQRLVPVAPPDEEALDAEHVDQHGLLGVRG
jgi:hypothetical protein